MLNQLEPYSSISYKTILITVGYGKGRQLSLHKSMFIGPQFNLDTYYEMISSGVDKILGYGLDIREIKVIEILVINQDRVWIGHSKAPIKPLGKRLYSTAITPIKTNVNIIPGPITTINIKTVTSNT